jgi:hypothetical protein
MRCFPFLIPQTKGAFMTWNLLGKILFPRLSRWERIQKTKIAASVFFSALIFAGCVGVVIYIRNAGHPN